MERSPEMHPTWNTSPFNTSVDLPEHPRPKRSRSFQTDADLELDSYFRSKRFMTDCVTKEMDEIKITQNPITTSPSRTSAINRLAQRGPSLSGVSQEMSQQPPSPRLNTSGSHRRRSLFVTSASDHLNTSSSSILDTSITNFDDMTSDDHDSSNDNNHHHHHQQQQQQNHQYNHQNQQQYQQQQYQQQQQQRGEPMQSPPILEWRSIKAPVVPPMEATLRRLIEKRRGDDSKALVLYRSPTDIVKDAAQQALLDKIKTKPPAAGAFALKTAKTPSSFTVLSPEPINLPNTVMSQTLYDAEPMRLSTPEKPLIYSSLRSKETSPPPKFSLFSQPMALDQYLSSPQPMDLSMTPPVNPDSNLNNSRMDL